MASADHMTPTARIVEHPLSEPLLRAEDVAALLGVKPSSVYEYARTSQLPHVRIGRHVRFVRADLETWLGRQRQ